MQSNGPWTIILTCWVRVKVQSNALCGIAIAIIHPLSHTKKGFLFLSPTKQKQDWLPAGGNLACIWLSSGCMHSLMGHSHKASLLLKYSQMRMTFLLLTSRCHISCCQSSLPAIWQACLCVSFLEWRLAVSSLFNPWRLLQTPSWAHIFIWPNRFCGTTEIDPVRLSWNTINRTYHVHVKTPEFWQVWSNLHLILYKKCLFRREEVVWGCVPT